MKILAMDVGQSKSVACVYESESGQGRYVTVPTRPAAVRELVEAERPGRVVMEIGPLAGWICDLLRELRVEVQVAETGGEAWRWKSVKRKTDRDDALKLARLSAVGQITPVHVPAPGVRAWRELIGYRHGLVRRRTAIKNSIRSILTRQAVEWPEGQAGWSKARRKELDQMAQAGGDLWRLMLKEELTQLATVDAAAASAEALLDQAAARDQRVAQLMTIPGVGMRLAETVVAVLDDPRRFANRRKVGCYAGLTPRKIQSGKMDRQGRISGKGHELMRSLLVEVSWLGRRWNPWMKGVYERALKGSPARKKIAIVALARRLLVVCWAMLRDGTTWRAPERAALKIAA